MQKDFQKWHHFKRQIKEKPPLAYFHEGEIWFCHLGQNIGCEQDGKGDESLRPVIVLKKFNKIICLVIPLTKARKKGGQYHFLFSFRPDIQSLALLSQIRLIDGRRLKYRAGIIGDKDFLLLKEKIRQLII